MSNHAFRITIFYNCSFMFGKWSGSDEAYFLTIFIHFVAFFTSKYGYKMCLRIYLNGDGTGRASHLSLFFVVMRGHSDALLKWPFNQKVKLTPITYVIYPTCNIYCTLNTHYPFEQYFTHDILNALLLVPSLFGVCVCDTVRSSMLMSVLSTVPVS